MRGFFSVCEGSTRGGGDDLGRRRRCQRVHHEIDQEMMRKGRAYGGTA